MREEFEKLPSIKVFLPSFEFNEEINEYVRSGLYHQPEYSLGFFNGAWYAFQEQQKILDAYKLILKTQIGFDIANDVFECSKAHENQNILADCHNGVISKGEFLVNVQSDGGQSKEMSINIGKDGKIIKTGD